eukprot:TRINITY_DN1381_c0_g1_i3.p1 TRINITY_DN1381_c0_g1~~TRINITY_DN1381_c0_g1_i3.p1  ORF type:complete len:575 (+),score=66.33 TRINITY_DN1381_c0_g1_i3:93-1727(+)
MIVADYLLALTFASLTLARSEDSCANPACNDSAREDAGLLQMHVAARQLCTAEHQDPHASATTVDCCSGLQMCLGQFKGRQQYSYECLDSCKPSCTGIGDDPYETGQKVDCCAGSKPCLGDWNLNSNWHYKCYPQCEMEEYNAHFDISPDYLNISSRARGVGGNTGKLSDNFYLVIGDNGGCAGGCGDCCSTQFSIANKMKEYVANRQKLNPRSTLLFVLMVGDNFYWLGVKEGRFKTTWKDIYGEELTSVPWFAVLGNHDIGNDDPSLLCPFFKPRIMCTENSSYMPACGGPNPYSTKVQAYACNQMNDNKGGVDGELRENFVMPDFLYYYTIPALDLELLGMDYNWYDREGAGGNGFGMTGGAREVAKFCGGTDNMFNSMEKIRDASTKMMKERAILAGSRNVAIFSHYPDWAQNNINLRQQYLSDIPAHKQKDVRVLNFYGHAHLQRCDGNDSHGCVNFLTGGSGGCCGPNDVPAGFVSITWSDDGWQKTDCFLSSGCTLQAYTSVPQKTNVSMTRHSKSDVCLHTLDDPTCPGYRGGLSL